MNYLKRQGIGDYLNHLFTLLPKMILPGLPVAAIVFLPLGLAYGICFSSIGDAMGNLMNLNGEGGDFSNFWNYFGPLMGAYAWLLGGLLWYGLAGALMTALISRQSLALIKPELEGPILIDWRQVLRDAATLLGQGLILACVVFCAVLILMAVIIALMVLVVVRAGDGANSQALFWSIMVGALSMLAMLPFMYWIVTKTVVAAQVSVAEGSGGFVGLGRSFQLVRGSSWRVFGAYFVVNLVLSFALSVITSPVLMVAMLPGLLDFFKNTLGNLSNPEDSTSLASMASLFRSIGPGLGIVVWIQAVVMSLALPIFSSLLYTNLRIRKGEWPGVPDNAGQVDE